MVSSRIAEANFEALKDLVTTDVLEEIKNNLPKFSVSQRQDLAFNDEELVYSFLDSISLNVGEFDSSCFACLIFLYSWV